MKKLFYTLIASSLLLVSCDGSAILPTVTGVANEVILVINDEIYNTNVGDSIDVALKSPVPCLPQYEPMFSVSRTSFENFSSILKPARNIVMVDVGSTYSSVKIKTEEDKWSSPQSILIIQGPTIQEVADAIGKHKKKITDYIEKAEMDRSLTYLSSNYEESTMKEVKKHMGFHVTIPKNMVQSKKGKNFMWISYEKGKVTRNIVMYSYPYTEVDAFTREKLLQKRDSVLKANIPGPSEGSYMTTEYRYEPPIWEEINLNNKYATLTKGLWRVEGDFMGGPFVSMSCLDKDNQNVITVEVFLYGPNENKRNAMRQLEAVLYTVKPE